MYTKHIWKSATHFNFPYAQYLPKNMAANEKYPLVLFLHGAGERGDDPDSAASHGFLKYVREEGREYPFICIAPQCPQAKYWGCYTESLLAFLDEIVQTLPVDPKRVYLTGLSMGGTGTWMLAMAAPEKFAALVPVCGSGIYWYGCSMTHVPIYMFHGDCDDIVPMNESVNMLFAVNSAGGNAKLEIYHGVGHNVYDYAYADDKMVNWMLEQKQK